MKEDDQLLDDIIDMDMKINMNGNGKVSENRENGVSKISVVDHINGKEYRNKQADCFIVDMEGISQLMDKDITANNSGIRFQRNLSRKSSQRGGEKKTKVNVGNEREANFVSTSPRALILQGGGDKQAVVTMGTPSTEVHNQTSTMAGNGTMTTDNKIGGKRLSFKRSSSSSSRAIQPKKILFFFATLSSIGTMLLIFFTLSMAKSNEDDNVALQ